jgi:hypothetical protein
MPDKTREGALLYGKGERSKDGVWFPILDPWHAARRGEGTKAISPFECREWQMQVEDLW